MTDTENTKMVTMTAHLERELWADVKRVALDRGIHLKVLIQEVLNDVVTKHKKEKQQ